MFGSIYEMGTKIYTEDCRVFMRGTKSDPLFFRIIFLKQSKILFYIVVCVVHRIEKAEQFPAFRRRATL
jgi:hypothetical protein